MHWSEVEQDAWMIPRERYNNDQVNAVLLNEPVQRIHGSTPRTSEYVFTTTGCSPIPGSSKAKAAIDKASGVKGWRLHDLRRTARSLMSRTGASSDIAERVLGYLIGAVAGVYDRHSFVAEKWEALRRLSGVITEIVCLPRR